VNQLVWSTVSKSSAPLNFVADATGGSKDILDWDSRRSDRSLKRADLESILQKTDYAPDRYHDENRDNTPEHKRSAFRPFLFAAFPIEYVFDKTPEENYYSDSNKEPNYCIKESAEEGQDALNVLCAG